MCAACFEVATFAVLMCATPEPTGWPAEYLATTEAKRVQEQIAARMDIQMEAQNAAEARRRAAAEEAEDSDDEDQQHLECDSTAGTATATSHTSDMDTESERTMANALGFGGSLDDLLA